MRAGQMNYPVDVEILSVSADAAGGQEEAWLDGGRLFTRRRDMSDGERQASGGREGRVMARFTARAGASVLTDGHRRRFITDAGETFLIEGAKIVDDGPMRGFVEFTGVRIDD